MSALEASQSRLKFNRFGLWLFFATEVAMFGGFLVLRFRLWGNTRPDFDQNLGLIVTSVLLISSLFMNQAEVAISKGNRSWFMAGLAITGVLGLVFLAGVVLLEWGLVQVDFPWHHEAVPLRPSDGVFGSVFFLMTGMHALHVLSGVAFIAIIWLKGRRGEFAPDSYWGVEVCAVYWHFVDVVWVFFYPALYLIGTVAA